MQNKGEKGEHLALNERDKLIFEGFAVAAKDLQSFQAAIQRLVENQAAQQAKLVEMAAVLNTHSQFIAELVSQVAVLSGKPPADSVN